jgi:hypothetical protein
MVDLLEMITILHLPAAPCHAGFGGDVLVAVDGSAKASAVTDRRYNRLGGGAAATTAEPAR